MVTHDPIQKIEPALQEAAPREPPPPRREVGRMAAGTILVSIGVLALATQLWPSEVLGLLVLPVLGGIFLAWAFLGRLQGLLIPGSILSGLGLGALAQQTLLATASGDVRGGVVVLGLALGFLAIMPLCLLLSGQTFWWPAIPGGVLLIVAVALLAGPNGVTFLRAVNYLWPLVPIAIGIWLLLTMGRSLRRDHREPH